MTLIKTPSPKLHLEARLAREKLHLEGEVPDGVLRAEIDASWRRSLSHGVHFNAKHELALESSASLDVLLASNRLLIDAALPAIDYLAERQGKEGLIILANSDATILAVEGRADRLKGSGLQDITLGACWSEAARGTNALGTALVEARPTMIDCGEHYLDRLSDFSCTSVPIHCPQGDILGVLDLTREGPLGRVHDSTALLAMAVSQIESRVFNASYPDEIVLAFHSRRQYLESPWQGLLAVSLGGQILAVSAQACQLLRAERSALVGRRCEEFLGVDGLQLLSRLHQGGVGSLQTAKGEFFYKTLRAPQRSINVSTPPRSPAKTAKPQPDLESLAGSNVRYARALRMARQGLANELPVLLLGETGTGKEVIARALHMAGTRCDKPFVAVNCAAIPEGLIESELFGYREGAFTGSRRGGMIGRLQQAHGGTLFLDEIGDMPLALQARLLRVLQDRKVAPLGAGEEQDIDVALICATHRDLKRLVEEKHFREDLFYRVNGISVMLPALREREDFSSLVARLLAKLDAPTMVLHDDLSRLLDGYHWPGNIRQLEMVLRTALAMREPGDTVLTLDHLPDSMLDELTATERPASGSIRENELELIRQALDSHQGNVSAAADALGISRATLYRKLKQLRS
ncbi:MULTISPECIES: sigma-54-dependent Fis family transcriptional regulator [unclassified Pseudomonas]|uniref:sigma-54-dependent Fis family transcriptional regulator n=1 Tax=unclassified Pseudomonas TaxID=196821 RepID=UPI000C86DEA0|nr:MULTISPECIES: sigma-54-dependent Fis family transcriptional regulator [unclassified Pseudomonas]PMV82912.1 sigma-54-dependent Fis family transcriptional regulator [Pseudomonas sp. GW101-1A09]PMV84128.1 sigma-54-dependent Fis family transcriptional regulator [Pseudomonas sp. FW306-2-2C-B10A]PMV96723.1 sigma-54-dependent Fis family transcriptional regulator [Pseudomonas sp. GW460-C8]PMW00375.1 sigma-54-dependent Fis family transcriptional regulator [Pseudomonas sp. MPR-TSA4]PMW05594.1 sigma-5